MLEADCIVVDIGPGAGAHGGQVVAVGTPQEIMAVEGSPTGDYLSGRKKIEIPAERKKPDGRWIEIRGAQENNLKTSM